VRHQLIGSAFVADGLAELKEQQMPLACNVCNGVQFVLLTKTVSRLLDGAGGVP
jgi:hypothetical protein